jgi:deoxyribodipyrimidine photolyase-related protein
MNIVLVLPNSLFENNILINSTTKVYIIEHSVYFTMYNYHKLKLILHRASMKYYEQFIKNKYNCNVVYINFDQCEHKINKLFNKTNKNIKISMYDPVDHDVMKNIKQIAKKYNTQLYIEDTPLFMTKLVDLEKYYNNYTKNKKLHHSHFYKWQREHHNILVKYNSKNNKIEPINKKWTFDVKNRLPFPKDICDKDLRNKDICDKDLRNKDICDKDLRNKDISNNKYIQEAKNYIEANFANNPGSTDFYLSIDHKNTKKAMKLFVKNRLKLFGPYQDAVNKNIIFGYHSVLSPLMNIGLITPTYVVKYVLNHAKKHKIPFESLEGYIRQIVGWREYCRLIYMFKYKELRNKNHFNHKRKFNKQLWYYNNSNNSNNSNTSTQFEFIDDLIKKTIKYGYLHHIERLMYIGNYAIINKIDPKDVFEWFQSMNIDSYHVFMYPNVYGMSQHSAGPIMMSRPYFSSSNYINKMSNYPKSKLWDALYYNFINDNIDEFTKNYAISPQVKHWINKSPSEKKKIILSAKNYMKYY